jgi:lipopolysaccharide biosynthesis glycosyltransferase
MKILLATIAIGDNYRRVYEEIFKESQEAYAAKHGYDFKIITDYLDTSHPEHHHKDAISLNKLLLCSQEPQYDMIIYMDADILININAPAIHNCIDYEDKIGMVDEYSQPSLQQRLELQVKMKWEPNASEYYKKIGFNLETDILLNGGVMVFQPHLHRHFLEDIYNKYVSGSLNHSKGLHYEQACIGYELQQNNLYKILPNTFNAIWALTKMSYNDTISLNDYYAQNHFIHFAGKVDYDKVYFLYHPEEECLTESPNETGSI